MCLGFGEATSEASPLARRLASGLTGPARLCACRGVMEAASAAVLLQDCAAAPSDPPAQLLVSASLPWLVEQLAGATDASARFLAVTAVKACLQRLRRLWEETQASRVMPLVMEEALVNSLLRTLWLCWEDPRRQVAKEAHSIFAALLDVLALQTAAGAPAPAALLGGVVRELLEQGAERKGRYAPLASLVARLGPQALLELRPQLVQESLRVLDTNRLCTAVGGLLRALWAASRDSGVEGWVPQAARDLAAGLCEGGDAASTNIGAHILPLFFEIGGADAYTALLAALAGVTQDKSALAGARLTALSSAQAAGLLDQQGSTEATDASLADVIEHVLAGHSRTQRWANGGVRIRSLKSRRVTFCAT